MPKVNRPKFCSISEAPNVAKPHLTCWEHGMSACEKCEYLVTPKPITLGFTLIMKNEEEVIARTLASIEGVDEIVVVDTGSTDSSVSIAESMGAKVVHFDWCDDFAAARNFGIRNCTADWLLLMDADEVIDPGGIDTARKAIEETLKVRPALQSIQVLMYHERDEFYSDRLIINDPDNTFYVYPIHEYCNSVRKIRTDEIKISFTPRPNAERNFRMIEKFLGEQPDDLRMQYCAAREYFVAGHNPTAVYWFDRYVRNYQKLKPPGYDGELADVHFTCGWAYGRIRDFDKAEYHFMKAIQINPDFKEAFEFLSQLALMRGNQLQAERWGLFCSTAQNRGLNFKTKGVF